MYLNIITSNYLLFDNITINYTNYDFGVFSHILNVSDSPSTFFKLMKLITFALPNKHYNTYLLIYNV